MKIKGRGFNRLIARLFIAANVIIMSCIIATLAYAFYLIIVR